MRVLELIGCCGFLIFSLDLTSEKIYSGLVRCFVRLLSHIEYNQAEINQITGNSIDCSVAILICKISVDVTFIVWLFTMLINSPPASLVC